MEKLDMCKIKKLSKEQKLNIIKENEKLKKDSENKEKEMESLIKENEKLTKEIEMKLLKSMKEKTYIIDKEIYKLYDSYQQNVDDNIQTKDLLEKEKSEKLFNEFKNCISKINIDKNNNNININMGNNIDEKNKFLDKNDINNIINHRFGVNLTISNFLKFVDNAIINNINKNWDLDHRVKLFLRIEIICYTEIKKIFYDEIPEHIKQLKLEILLNIFLQKKYLNDDIMNNLIMIRIENYSTVPLSYGIKFLNPVDNKTYIFNKDYIIKRITNNVGIMNAYYKTIQKYVTDKFDKNNLKQKLIEIINNTNIYFCDIPKDIFSFIICNGDIFIKGKYLEEAFDEYENEKENYYNFTAISKIYMKILHELANKLIYILREEYNNKNRNEYNNYFYKSFLFKSDQDFNFDLLEDIDIDKETDYYEINKNNIKEISNKEINDIINYNNLHNNQNEFGDRGNFFDDEIFLGKRQTFITKKISELFLLSSCKNYKNYVKVMTDLIENCEDSNEQFVEEGGTLCYHSYVRGYNK